MIIKIKTASLLIFFVAAIIISSSIHAKDYRIKWKESGGKILYDTVCYNQSARFDKTPCKHQAKRYFTKKCKQTGSSKFCAAANGFKPGGHGNLGSFSR